jgi:RNA polymerase sigma factor (TIGR02999 family)
MTSDDRGRITESLLRVSRGGARAAELVPLVYEQLHALAERWFKSQPKGATLQPTALVHEAFLRLVDPTGAGFNDRAHFCAAAAVAMRRILIDRARRRATDRRGSGWQRVELDTRSEPAIVHGIEDLLALDEALVRLAGLNERHARVVEMRFFGGLTVEEVAAALGVTTRTVELDWRAARAWLKAELSSEHRPS